MINREAGYSLVEMTAGLMTFGILAVTIIPRFFELGPYQERGYFDETVSATRYAQKLAVSSGCDVRFSITPAGYSLQQRAACDTTSAFTVTVENPGTSEPFAAAAPAGLTLSTATIIFTPSGQAANVARVLTDFTGIAVGAKTFDVIGSTGYVDAQ